MNNLRDNKKFSIRKAMLGSVVGPLTIVAFWDTHSVCCIGPMVFFTLACWLLVFLGARELIRDISGQ